MRLLIGSGALAAAFAFSCHDKDAIWITDPNGSGGSSGETGTAGTGGGGSGNGGNGGSGMAGAAGSSTGGNAGSASGGSAGAAGSGAGGSAGSAGAAGDGNVPPPDAGTDGGDVPDSGGPQQLTQAQALDAICARMDEVASCSPPPDPCQANNGAGWDFFKSTFPNCATIVDAYFFCMAGEPVTSYGCDSDTPLIPTPQTGNCADEDAAFQEVQGGTAACAQ